MENMKRTDSVAAERMEETIHNGIKETLRAKRRVQSRRHRTAGRLTTAWSTPLLKIFVAQETARRKDNVAYRIPDSSKIGQRTFMPKVEVENKVWNHGQTKRFVCVGGELGRKDKNPT